MVYNDNENYSINECPYYNDDDLIKNYTFEFEGFNFLEPRFYFSRKHRRDEKNTKDWEGIENFYKMESKGKLKN